MELPYKIAMGASTLPRLDFLKRLDAARAAGPVAIVLPPGDDARALLDAPPRADSVRSDE